ncbi:MAG TPA: ubiquinone/menaquinone biosynthesis methyltransferase [Solirubrobacteraceae bacterium]|nr:ubiquinone/menaquinone biosynthesis methyltransferase [Solirubrobacteraceae bacterium]
MSANPETHASPRKHHAHELFERLPRQYHTMGALMSFGQDPRWRRMLVAAIAPRPGERVLDVATGTGLVAMALARSGCEVVAIDQSESMLSVARAQLARASDLAGRVRFVTGEAERLPFEDGEFDAVSFTYLLRYVDDRSATLRELARVLKPGGRIGMVEFGVPPQSLLRALWRVHTRTFLPLLGRLASPAWVEAGRFLGPSIEQLYVREPDLAALWRASGIENIYERRPSFGAGVVIWGKRSEERVD